MSDDSRPTRSELAQELLSLGTATLGESGGLTMDPSIRPVWLGGGFAGLACPVICSAGDNLAIHAALTRAQAGYVLVVSTGGIPERGYWGEVLTTAAKLAGIAALVIDGGVRDSASFARHEFPVFARLIALRGTTKSLPGSVGLPLDIGGVGVVAGDWVVGDADGVVVVSRSELDAVRAAAIARVAKETQYFEALRAGATTLELMGVDATQISTSWPAEQDAERNQES
jgi:4-hydroxy-4-methyl-2-oxoglutarate aldolase